MSIVVCATVALLLGAGRLAENPVCAAGNCVKYSQSQDPTARSLNMRLENKCDQEMVCTVTWAVTCITQNGDVTTPGERVENLPPGIYGVIEASAASCARTDGYRISGIRWNCLAAE
jgi:hypothetical protein